MRTSNGRRFVSPSLYGFVKGREPVTPEEVAREFLALPQDGNTRTIVGELIVGDPRFLLEEGSLRIVDAASLPLGDAPYVVFDVETTGSSAEKGPSRRSGRSRSSAVGWWTSSLP